MRAPVFAATVTRLAGIAAVTHHAATAAFLAGSDERRRQSARVPQPCDTKPGFRRGLAEGCPLRAGISVQI